MTLEVEEIVQDLLEQDLKEEDETEEPVEGDQVVYDKEHPRFRDLKDNPLGSVGAPTKSTQLDRSGARSPLRNVLYTVDEAVEPGEQRLVDAQFEKVEIHKELEKLEVKKKIEIIDAERDLQNREAQMDLEIIEASTKLEKKELRGILQSGSSFASADNGP